MKCRSLVLNPLEFGEQGMYKPMGSVVGSLSQVRVPEESRGKDMEKQNNELWCCDVTGLPCLFSL